jgi:hypothetical protein
LPPKRCGLRQIQNPMVANVGTVVMELNRKYDRSTGKLMAKGLARYRRQRRRNFFERRHVPVEAVGAEKPVLNAASAVHGCRVDLIKPRFLV